MALNQIDPENVFMKLPECSLIDGNYLEKSCDETGSCRCQNRITGEKYPGEAKDMDCLGSFLLKKPLKVYNFFLDLYISNKSFFNCSFNNLSTTIHGRPSFTKTVSL